MTVDPIKARTVPYRAGERIVSAGEPGACLFVVQGGLVRLTRRGVAAQVEVGTLEKGDIFGECALIEGRPYGVDAEAATDCEVLELGPHTFDKMLRGHPEIAVRLLRQLAGRLERIEERLAAGAPTAAPVAAVEGPAVPAPAAAAAPGAARPAVPAKPRFARLTVEGNAVVFPLSGGEMLVGRYDPVTETQPEIDLGALDTKRSVSRRHARLFERDGVWHVVEEGGALNGTFVNGVKLQQGRPAPLSDGDTVSLGMVRLVFRES